MKTYHILLLSALAATSFVGCTDLNVQPYDQLTAESFYKNATQIQAGVNRAYTHANAWACPTGQVGYYRLSELSGDQTIWPQKGKNGYDGGDWGRLHYHTWTVTNDDDTWNAWKLMFWGMGFTNSTLGDFQNINFEAAGLTEADKAAYTGELKVFRAWHYLKLMDLYGNIPIVTQVGVPENPPTEPRDTVFNFVESQVKENLDAMFPLSATEVGHMNKAAAYAMLIELYLNSEVWTGKARWQDCIDMCNKLIPAADGGDPDPTAGGIVGGKLALDDDINNAFCNTNSTTSKEDIFQIFYNKSDGMWLGRSDYGYYDPEKNMLNTDDSGNNGIVVTPNAYNAYSKYDKRKYHWFMYGMRSSNSLAGADSVFQGPYPNISTTYPGNPYALGTVEYTGLPLIFTYKPVKAVVSVSGTSSDTITNRHITITEWDAPEFQTEEAKDRMQNVFNATPVAKSNIVNAYDNGNDEVYLSGSYNNTGEYSWSTKDDYRHIWNDCAENTGARMIKYFSGHHGDPNYGDNGFVLYRLTWVYFAKAEAEMRMNGGVATQDAVNLINKCKSRAFDPAYWNSQAAVDNGDRYTTATLTMDELLAEYGREFIFEGWRRQTLIRFGKFEFGIKGWWDSTASDYTDGSNGTINSDKSRELFAIPSQALDANPALKQNPGY